MLSQYEAAALAQFVFYTAAILLVIYFRCRRPSVSQVVAMAPLLLFPIIRLVEAVLISVRESEATSTNARGLTMAAMILQNVGLLILTVIALVMTKIRQAFPFLVLLQGSGTDSVCSLVGFLGSDRYTNRLAKITVPLLVVSLGLLNSGVGTTTTVGTISKKLTIAGYCLIAADLVIITISLLCLHRQGKKMPDSSISLIFRNVLLAVPFLALQIAYGLLSAVNNRGNPAWGILSDSPLQYSLMVFLPECIVYCIYLRVQWHGMPEDLQNDGDDRVRVIQPNAKEDWDKEWIM
ncbi:hypothetical protein GQ53DRAFT_840604 [Thozetella sp. PMI_491]|nr:hypothetical protein GQ53DRAFT_840604 [Thozetella sp. PMI_491]